MHCYHSRKTEKLQLKSLDFSNEKHAWKFGICGFMESRTWMDAFYLRAQGRRHFSAGCIGRRQHSSVDMHFQNLVLQLAAHLNRKLAL
jgi:hypothetical protein